MPQVLIHDVGIYYEEKGSDIPLIFLCGLGQETRSWGPQVNFFSQKGFRAIVYDTRGQGGSDRPNDPQAYGFSHHVEDVIGLMDHLKIDRAHLVGLSHGGTVAQGAALHFPERIHSLVLVNTLAYVTSLIRHIFQGWIHACEVGGSLLRFDATLPWLFSERFLEANGPFIKTLRELSKDRPTQTVVHLLRSSLAHNLRDKVSQISAPTLVLCGEQDLLTPPPMSRYLHEQIKGSKLVIIPETGHVLPIEVPDLFNQTVLDFLTRVKPASP